MSCSVDPTPTPRTILVVEDERQMRTLLASILSREGYRVRLAANGAEGLEVLRRDRPDLVLLDLGLPHLSGAAFRAVQRKMAPEMAAIPVVVVSGSENAAAEAERLGAVSCLRKPFTPSDIVRIAAKHTGFAEA
jgi:CheY-like chemotaxis protein